MTDKKIHIKAINNGTTIDHIPAGKALDIMEALEIDKKTTVGIGINVDSGKMGKKDLIFVENLELKGQDFAKIGLIAKGATINLIRDGKVIEKVNAETPEKAVGIIKCINPKCITNYDHFKSKFTIEKEPKIRAKCRYCETMMSEEDIIHSMQ